jgi:ElaA protein
MLKTNQSPSFFCNEIPFTYIVKPFQELTIDELYQITKVRQEVFVVEQECVFTDSDGFDPSAFHLLIYDADKAIAGYARVLPAGTIYDKATIGRVLTIQKYRKTGLGRQVFGLAVAALYQYLGPQPIKIQAQSYLLTFYESFGFTAISDAYLDTGILHNDMVKD